MVNCCTLKMMRQNAREWTKRRASTFSVNLFMRISKKLLMVVFYKRQTIKQNGENFSTKKQLISKVFLVG